MSKGKVIIGALAGVAAGAILGVLFAPEKGSKTRHKIAKKSSDTVHDGKKKISNLMDGIVDKFEEEKEEIAETYGKVKDKISNFTKGIQSV